MTAPDVILFDSSENEQHLGLEVAVRLANAYPDAHLLLSHWGTVDAPDFSPFNGDPKQMEGRVDDPKRIYQSAPHEPFVLRRGKQKR